MLESHLEGLVGTWRDPRGSHYELSQESKQTLSVSSLVDQGSVRLECRGDVPQIYWGTSFRLDAASLTAQINQGTWPPASIVWVCLSGSGEAFSWTRVSESILTCITPTQCCSKGLAGGFGAQSSPTNVSVGHQNSSCLGMDLDTFGPPACIVAVQRHHIVEHLLCVKCEDSAGSGVFQFATNNVTQIVGSESLLAELDVEGDDDDPDLKAALIERGEPWTGCCMLVGATDGKHAGLRAVGLGSNLKKRRRAAHVALAATALAGMMLTDGNELPDEDDSHADAMMDLARAALRAQIELSKQADA